MNCECVNVSYVQAPAWIGNSSSAAVSVLVCTIIVACFFLFVFMDWAEILNGDSLDVIRERQRQRRLADPESYDVMVMMQEAMGLNRRETDLRIKKHTAPKAQPPRRYVRGRSKNTCCPICLEEYVRREKVTVLPCKHDFHTRCVSEWARKNPSCPVCRADFVLQ